MKEKVKMKNKYGIEIVACCASCLHKHAGTEHSRICDAGEGVVSPKHLCIKYEMHDRLQEAGKGGGRVKKKDYLDFLLNYEQPEDEKLRIKLSQQRAEYMEKYGNIYLNR